MLTYYKFHEDELRCPCCGRLNISKPFIERLLAARLIAGIPFYVNSCCRCEKHNKEIGGSPTSAHLDGEAADLRVRNSRERFIILRALILAGFNRIGIGKDFIHVDSSTNPDKDPEVIWLY